MGIRVRGSTSRDAIKKSWKLSPNKFASGRQFHGVEKLNRNGDRDDPSVIRSKLAMDLYKEAGVPSPRVRHARLKINDGSEVEGAFFLVEQVDEEFAAGPFALGSTEEKIDRIYRETLPFVYEGSYRNRRVDRGYDKSSFILSYTEPDFSSEAGTPGTTD